MTFFIVSKKKLCEHSGENTALPELGVTIIFSLIYSLGVLVFKRQFIM